MFQVPVHSSLVSPFLSHHNYTLMVGKVGCLIYVAALLVSCLVGSVLDVDIDGVAKKKWVTSGFGFKVMIGGYICIIVPCILQLYCGTISKVAYNHSDWHFFC